MTKPASPDRAITRRQIGELLFSLRGEDSGTPGRRYNRNYARLARRTGVWDVLSVGDRLDSSIGVVEWSTSTKHYVFAPRQAIRYPAVQLHAIADFVVGVETARGSK